MYNNEVVSVAVITYNSSATVLQTLNSILEQTYGSHNIELIISDDASLDNTVEVVQCWIDLHGKKFHSIDLIENKVNGGISKNCNIAWQRATSEWIKSIAGDDLLLKDCLLNNMHYVKTNKDVRVVFSKMQSFSEDICGVKLGLEFPNSFQKKIFNLSAREQFNILSKIDGISVAPTSFIDRKTLAEIGYADERFPLIEDYPLWFKLTKYGIKLHYFDKATVMYRVGNSISQAKNELTNLGHIIRRHDIDIKLVFPHLEKTARINKLRRLLSYQLMILLVNCSGNKKNNFTLIARKLIMCIKPYCFRSKFIK